VGENPPVRPILRPLAVALLGAWSVAAGVAAQSVANNPYRAVHGWAKLPEGRTWGAVSGVLQDPDGRHMWVLDRCGANGCVGSNLDPILKFDMDGNLVSSFGRGMFSFPHGFLVDREGNIWVTEGASQGDPRAEAGTKAGLGHQVFKLSPRGEVLMALGTAGVPGHGPRHFNGPTGVVVAANGDIWITDGHRGGNNRLVRFSARGEFIQEIGGGVGSESAEAGGFNDPHGLALDSQGRIFVADRGNNRIQIFDRDGKFVDQWTQFGRPSAVYVDADDVIYVSDSMSNPTWHTGWERGIRIGDAKTGWVTAFIPDPEPHPERFNTSGAEFLAVDASGNIYGAEVGPIVGSGNLVKYIRIRP
jgi:DNA-binding beta-propeller fold protein YncE